MPAAQTGSSGPLALRLRWKGGVQRIEGLKASSTALELMAQIEDMSQCPITSQKLLLGYPPKEMKLSSPDQTLGSIPVANGETLILEEVPFGGTGTLATVGSGATPTSTAPPTPTTATPTPTASTTPATSNVPTPSAPQSSAPKSTTTPSTPSQPASSKPSTTTRPSSTGAGVTMSHPVDAKETHSSPLTNTDAVQSFGDDDTGYMVRRVVKADNSCLFTSLGYVLEGHDRQKGLKLRKVVADAVMADPERFNEAILDGKSNKDYAAWIQDSKSWGGAIELAILSEYYKTEIGVVSIEEMKVWFYGEGNNYPQRVFVLYDNIHYDPLALTFVKDSTDEELDVTIFDPTDTSVVEKAKKLAGQLNKQSQFTNTSKFTLRCLVCRSGLVGEKEAMEHAKTTGHCNFAEYK